MSHLKHVDKVWHYFPCYLIHSRAVDPAQDLHVPGQPHPNKQPVIILKIRIKLQYWSASPCIDQPFINLVSGFLTCKTIHSSAYFHSPEILSTVNLVSQVYRLPVDADQDVNKYDSVDDQHDDDWEVKPNELIHLSIKEASSLSKSWLVESTWWGKEIYKPG